MIRFHLKGALEFTAACGVLFAAAFTLDVITYAMALVIIALWSLRIRDWAIRWWIFSWSIACCTACLGLVFLEQAFITDDPEYDPSDYWLMFGCAAMTMAPLAFIIGLVFMAEWVGRDRKLERKKRQNRKTHSSYSASS